MADYLPKRSQSRLIYRAEPKVNQHVAWVNFPASCWFHRRGEIKDTRSCLFSSVHISSPSLAFAICIGATLSPWLVIYYLLFVLASPLCWVLMSSGLCFPILFLSSSSPLFSPVCFPGWGVFRSLEGLLCLCLYSLCLLFVFLPSPPVFSFECANKLSYDQTKLSVSLSHSSWSRSLWGLHSRHVHIARRGTLCASSYNMHQYVSCSICTISINVGVNVWLCCLAIFRSWEEHKHSLDVWDLCALVRLSNTTMNVL